MLISSPILLIGAEFSDGLSCQPPLLGRQLCGGYRGARSVARRRRRLYKRRMPTGATITSLVPRSVIRAAAAEGLSTSPLFQVVGFGAQTGANSDLHVEIERYYELWDRIMSASGDPSFPVRAALASDIEENEVFGFLAMSCQTLAEAFAKTARYRDLYNIGARWEMEPDGAHVRLIFYPWPGDRTRLGVRAAIEYGMAHMFRTGNQLSGLTLRAHAVRIAHSAPARWTAHAELFGVEPVFGALDNELVLDSAILGIPVTSFNSGLRAYFEQQCKELAARFSAETPLAARVHKELIAAMDGGDPSIASISKRLGMSGRSLQRRLAEEDRRFDALLDDVRQEFAKRYLSKGTVSASEIAFLVGFQSPTAFFRAFKRWTGGTPGNYQRAAVQPA